MMIPSSSASGRGGHPGTNTSTGMNLVVDLLYFAIDPRLRVDDSARPA